MNQTPTLQQLITDAIEARVTDIHVGMPGIVQSFDAIKQTINVQPVIKRKYSDNSIVNLPLLINVPVVFPRTTNAYLFFPIKKNDYVWLSFSERSLDVFLQKGGIVDPGDYRKHSLSDAVAFAGIYPAGSELSNESDDVALVNNLSRVSLDENGNTKVGIKGNTQTENVVLGQVLKSYLEDLHTKLSSLLDKLITGDFLLSTSPGSPTAPNPARTPELTALKAELDALKASPITDEGILSDIFFTEKGN